MKINLLTLGMFIMLALFSNCDDYREIGIVTNGEFDLAKIRYTEDFKVKVYNTFNGNWQPRNYSQLPVGNYEDPILGEVSVTSYFLLQAGYYSGGFLSSSSLTQYNIPSDAQLDSVKLQLHIASTSKTISQSNIKIQVYPLKEYLVIPEDGRFTNQIPFDEKLPFGTGVPKVSKYVRDSIVTDTFLLTLTGNRNFGTQGSTQELFDDIKDKNTAIFQNGTLNTYNLNVSWVRGFVLKAESPNQELISFDIKEELSFFEFFHSSPSDTSSFKLYFRNPGLSSLSNWVSLKSPIYNNQVGNTKNDDIIRNIYDLAHTDSVYLKDLYATSIVLSFEDLLPLKDSGNVVINEATIEIDWKNVSQEQGYYVYLLDSTISFFNQNAGSLPWPINSRGFIDLDFILRRQTARTIFTTRSNTQPLTGYLQELVQKGEAGFKLLIYPRPISIATNGSISPRNEMDLGTASFNKSDIKLKIYYSVYQ